MIINCPTSSFKYHRLSDSKYATDQRKKDTVEYCLYEQSIALMFLKINNALDNLNFISISCFKNLD